MTYCIGVKLDEGMIFASDSRTNAGLDNIAKFCKMTVFERRNDRVLVLLSSGNLAGTQAIIGVLMQRGNDPDTCGSIWTANTMFEERRNLIGPNLSISYKTPLKIVRGSGAYLYDDVGSFMWLTCSRARRWLPQVLGQQYKSTRHR